MDKRMKPQLSQNMNAILIVCLGWLFFSLADTNSKFLVQYYPVNLVLFINGSLGALFCGAWLLIRDGWKGFHSEKWKWHILRGICVTGTAYTVVHSLYYLPLSDFYGISFLSPFIIAVLSHLLLKEAIGWHRMVAILIGFAGVLVLAQPQFETNNVGLVWALMVPIFVSLNALIVRKIGPNESMALFAFVPFLSLALFILIIGHGDFSIPAAEHAIWFILSPLLVTGGLIGFALGFAKATESSAVVPFGYTQIFWGTLLGYLVFGDIPAPATIAGLTLIIGAGLYVLYREHQIAQSQNSR